MRFVVRWFCGETLGNEMAAMRVGLGLVYFSYFACCQMAWADVRMPAIFGDHMVLQEEMQDPFWGWADPGETITVTVGGNKVSTVTRPDGKWRADVFVSRGYNSFEVTVAGKNTLKFTDVLAGDVWLASGQSNMEFPVKLAHKADTELPQANDTGIHLFIVPRRRAITPVDDIVGFTPGMYEGNKFFGGVFFPMADDCLGKWTVCNPDIAAKFSAIAYFFAKDLRTEFKKPIGLIGSYYGGSPAQSWISRYGLYAEPQLRNTINEIKNAEDAFPGGNDDVERKYAAFVAANAKWDQDMAQNPGKAAWEAAVKAWQEAIPHLQAEGKPIPPDPAPPIPKPEAPTGGFVASLLYNGMIAPIIPYGLKGFIWYQGESDAGAVWASLIYKVTFARLIIDWREKWGQGDLPFLLVQLAGNNAHPKSAAEVSPWGYMRETQFQILKRVPKTGMAMALDLGMTTSIHPIDKVDVAHRLALVARRVAYGQDVRDSGPLFDSMKIEGNQVYITFSCVNDGLTIGAPPWIEPGVPPLSTTEVQGFSIAGVDKKFVWATAKIEGNSVTVSSAQVPNPVAVRYGWADNPVCNLYNKDNLPACPFRTDDWN